MLRGPVVYPAAERVTAVGIEREPGWRSSRASLGWDPTWVCSGWLAGSPPDLTISSGHRNADLVSHIWAPVERAAALLLAREHQCYCPDIVEQGTGTVAAAAGPSLFRGKVCLEED